MSQGSAGMKIWDAPTRLFHWSLLALFALSWWSGESGGNAMVWHMRSGYAILTLVLFRLCWGWLGSDTARFNHFLRGPAAIVAYLRALRQRGGSGVIGHNPLGGLMVAVMLLLLLLQAGSGLFANDDIVNEGPLAHRISKALSDQLTSVHTLAFKILLGLALVHVLAVLFYLFYKKDNLVRPMLTGRRPSASATAPPVLHFASPGRGLAVLAVCIGLVYGLLRWA